MGNLETIIVCVSTILVAYLSYSVSQYQVTVLSLKETIQRLEVQNVLMKEEINAVKEDNNLLNNKLSSMASELTEIKANEDEMKIKLLALQSNMAKLENDKEQLSIMFDNLRMEFEQLKYTESEVKPAFHIMMKRNPFAVKGINDVVKFDDVKLDTHNGYDVSTGYYTIPRSGMYHIMATIMSHGNFEVQYQLNLNGELYMKGHSSSAGYDSSMLNVLLKLQKNDRMHISHRWADSYQEICGTHHLTSFSGHFLQS